MRALRRRPSQIFKPNFARNSTSEVPNNATSFYDKERCISSILIERRVTKHHQAPSTEVEVLQPPF